MYKDLNFILRATVKKADMVAWHTLVVLLLDSQEEELWAFYLAKMTWRVSVADRDLVSKDEADGY